MKLTKKQNKVLFIISIISTCVFSLAFITSVVMLYISFGDLEGSKLLWQQQYKLFIPIIILGLIFGAVSISSLWITRRELSKHKASEETTILKNTQIIGRALFIVLFLSLFTATVVIAALSTLGYFS